MKRYRTTQEIFWAGKFGNAYIDRNKDDRGVSRNVAFFSRILSRTQGIASVIELGANIGLNLRAIQHLLPKVRLSAVEINKKAAKDLNRLQLDEVFAMPLLDFMPQKTYDFVLCKGVLIHINPKQLHKVYETMYRSSARYICVAEYYNPKPVTVLYRNHREKLFKRDFAGEILEMFKDVVLLDYGFVYHRDTHFPQDDLTWFLLEKRL